MIDGVLSGLLGGMLADPLGNYSSRFRYRTVLLGGEWSAHLIPIPRRPPASDMSGKDGNAFASKPPRGWLSRLLLDPEKRR